MGKQRISIVIQNVGNEAKLINFLRKLKPTSVVVINDSGLLQRILAAVPSIQFGVIRWVYNDGQGEADGRLYELGSRPLTWLLDQWYKSGLHGNPRAYLYVSNEPAPRDSDVVACVRWHVWAAQELRKHGIRAVLMNAQPAVFRKEVVDAGVFDALLYELSDGYHLLGWHEYGGPIPPIGTNGGNKYDMLDKSKCQQASWPTFEQVRHGDISDNWLIGRLYWWDDRAENVLRVAAPLKLITEAGQDRLDVYDDIYKALEARYGIPSPYVCMRGVNTYRTVYNAYYKEAYPTDTFENTVLAFLKWWDSIYDNTVLGINLFIWSPDKDDWDRQFGFDYSRLTRVHELLWEWTEEMTHTIPAGEGVPVIIQASDGKTPVRFRREPSPNGEKIGLILAPVEARMFTETPDPEMLLGGVVYKMRQFKIGEQRGWAAVDLLTITLKEDDPTIPVPTSHIVALGDRVKNLRQKAGEVVADLDALARLIADMER